MTEETDTQQRTQHVYRTQGTCSRALRFELDEQGNVHDVAFDGGCNGNLKGIGSLIEGMDARLVIERVEGTTCGSKPTSCPDQLARALKAALAEREA